MKFRNDLMEQPEQFCLSRNQKFCVASTKSNFLWIDIENEEEVDIDEIYEIDGIRKVIHDPEDGVFYLLANEFQGKIGFFLLRLNEDHPRKYQYLSL